MKRKSFKINPKRPTAVAAVIALALSIPMQIAGYADRLGEPAIALMLVLLPVLSAFLMILVMLMFGQDRLWLSIVPLSMGVVSFFFKLVVDPRGTSMIHHIAASILYVAVIMLWALTVFYVIKTKWVLALLFMIPFVKHIAMNDIPVLLGTAEPVAISIWLKEFSMLLLMLGLSLCAMSFDKPD